jgi:hypothetical protein
MQPALEPGTYRDVAVTIRVYQAEHLHTYQDLVARFGWSYKTVWRRFHKRKLFRPTRNTVRVPESEVQKLIQESIPSDEKKTKRS